MLFFTILAGVAYGQLPAACTEGEFLANGLSTGQNIDMNYDASGLQTAGGATSLKVQFFVPRRYTETYENNAFAITFNRELSAVTAADQVTMTVGQVGVDQSACYSNRYGNYTYCKREDAGLWTFGQNAENECITDASAVIPWADVMGTAFSGQEVKQNGRFTEVFLTATVETWTHFVETTGADYKGQMTGGEQWLNTDIDNGDTNRQGEYGGDAGWRGWPNDEASGNFGPLLMDDERYTLYQIPFVLRFPRTVVVETTFTAASVITTLTAVLGQDTIQVDMNPGEDGNFAQLEAVITTQTQYPYAIRGPDDDPTGMNAFVGEDTEGTNGDHAESIEFIEYDQEGSCGGQGMCTQTFKVRITPTATNRCSVAGKYFFEFWAKCQNGGEGGTNGCPIDDLATDADLEVARTSNAYLSQTVTINHQPFCPELMDEVRVVGDINVFHDESFTTNIADSGYDVFTNDFLFYEASYRTSSASLTTDAEFHDNDFDNSVVGGDSIIDYVRSTKIFMDVTIGKGSDGSATAAWNGNNWNDNFDFAGDNTNPLGGTRIPGTDITGSDITVTNPSGDHAKYNILLCQADKIPAAEIMFDKAKPTDCFSGKQTIALDFLDFDHVLISSAPETGDANNIDENEVAFKMRMDERIIPLKPLKTDGSHVTITVEAEVYYKGNRHSTRRLLQTDNTGSQRQMHSMSTSHGVSRRQELSKCTVPDDSVEGFLTVELGYDKTENMPSAAGSLDWATRLSMQLDAHLESRGAVSVFSIEKCNSKSCKSIYKEGSDIKQRRRMEKTATHMKVNIKIHSTKKSNAGVFLNKLQDMLMAKDSSVLRKVSALDNADVVDMNVRGCNESTVKAERKVADEITSELLEDEESSAAALSVSLVSLFALWSLL